jgi:hypothetical protein
MRLGAVVPAPGVETTLYAPPANTRATLKVFVNNRNAGVANVTVIHRPGAGPSQPEDRVADEEIPAGANRRSEYFDVTNPEELRVISDVGNVVFQANTIEPRTA